MVGPLFITRCVCAVEPSNQFQNHGEYASKIKQVACDFFSLWGMVVFIRGHIWGYFITSTIVPLTCM